MNCDWYQQRGGAKKTFQSSIWHPEQGGEDAYSRQRDQHVERGPAPHSGDPHLSLNLALDLGHKILS